MYLKTGGVVQRPEKAHAASIYQAGLCIQLQGMGLDRIWSLIAFRTVLPPAGASSASAAAAAAKLARTCLVGTPPAATSCLLNDFWHTWRCMLSQPLSTVGSKGLAPRELSNG